MSVRKIVPASANGNVEFSRHVGPLRVSTSLCHGIQADQIVEGIAKFSCVHHFALIDSGKRVTNHVSYAIEGGLEGCLVSGMETINDVGGVFDLDATELNVLARGDVHDTLFGTVFFDAGGVKSHEVRVDDAIGDLEAHHELTRRSLVSVKHTNVFQSLRK